MGNINLIFEWAIAIGYIVSAYWLGYLIGKNKAYTKVLEKNIEILEEMIKSEEK